MKKHMKKPSKKPVKKSKEIEKKDKIKIRELEVKKINKKAILPKYSMESDVGLDLISVERICLHPMEQKTVKTGIAIHIPEKHVGLIRDRAGMVSKMNVHTAAGTFDPSYRGEVSVVLVNFGDEEVEIDEGMKIAQLIILPATKVKVKEVKKLSETERGEKGFGSTGFKEKMDALNELSKAIKEK